MGQKVPSACGMNGAFQVWMKIKTSRIQSLALSIALTFSSVAPLTAASAETEKSLYERLGGIYSVAAVVDHFSDAVVKNPIVGKNSKNPSLRKWHRQDLGRLPGLKFMRTLWVSSATGGPLQYVATRPGKTNLGLELAHHDFKISPAEFDEVAAELGRSLVFFKVPKQEKDELLTAFNSHKAEVTAGYSEKLTAK